MTLQEVPLEPSFCGGLTGRKRFDAHIEVMCNDLQDFGSLRDLKWLLRVRCSINVCIHVCFSIML